MKKEHMAQTNGNIECPFGILLVEAGIINFRELWTDSDHFCNVFQRFCSSEDLPGSLAQNVKDDKETSGGLVGTHVSR